MRPSMGAVEGLNVQRLAAALGDELPLVLKTDAPAARGVLMRQGVGKVRHLLVKQLWLQENVAAGELVIAKIPRVENYADALTHPWSAHDLPFWEAMGICFIRRIQVSMNLPISVFPLTAHRKRGIQVTRSEWPVRQRNQSTFPSEWQGHQRPDQRAGEHADPRHAAIYRYLDRPGAPTYYW